MDKPALRFDLITSNGTVASLARLEEIQAIPGMGHINNQDDLVDWAANNNTRVEIARAPVFDSVESGQAATRASRKM